MLPFDKESLQQAELDFIRVAENVSEVKPNDGTKVLHAVGVAIDKPRLYGVLDLPAGDCSIKNFAKHRRAQLNAGSNRLAVKNIIFLNDAGPTGNRCWSRKLLL